jgi:4-hydroxy-tetrahydrodipicolinate synthase
MKYRKNEAKEYARTALKGVWTALPYHFTADDKLDEKSIAHALDYSISELKIDGHYCSGNVAEFWSLTDEERMRAHEINVEANKGRVPLIAGCHHQNPYDVVKLAKHAEAIGIDFVIILTPYQGAKNDDAVFDFYRFISERVNIGIVLFNIPSVYYPISEHLAARLAKLPNIAGFKQGGPSPAASVSLRQMVGKDLTVSVADETPWLYNLTVMKDQWLLNYCPHLYQVPGYLPIHDYTKAAMAGDYKKAIEICATLTPLREIHAKWVGGYGKPHGRMPSAEMKYWMECIGMPGGPVRTPCLELPEDKKAEMYAELKATGILDRVKKPARKAA